MQAERWKQVERLYEEAVTLPAEKRAEFLAQACRTMPTSGKKWNRCSRKMPIRSWKAFLFRP